MSADNCELATYAELAAVLDAAPLLLRERRRERRLSMRAAAGEIGCGATTILRFESGDGGIATDTLIQIVRWLGDPRCTEKVDHDG